MDDSARTGTRRPAGALLATATAAGLAASLISLAFSHSRSAGTGTHLARGWPRSFYFAWSGMDGGGERSGINWLYLLENWLLWAAAAALLLLAARALRRRPG